MSDTLAKLEQKYQDLVRLHADIYEQLALARKNIAQLTMEEMADCVSVLNDAEKLADDTRKECKFLSELMQKTCCVIWTTTSDGGAVRGVRCTATPQIKQMCALPNQKRDPENYAKLMEFLGVPAERIADGTVNLHWPKLVEFMTKRAEEGLPLPPGLELSKTYDIYSLMIRKKDR